MKFKDLAIKQSVSYSFDEWPASETEPNLALSCRDIIERYVRRMPLPQLNQEFDEQCGDEDSMNWEEVEDDFQAMDYLREVEENRKRPKIKPDVGDNVESSSSEPPSEEAH